MRYTNADDLRGDFAGCANQVTFPPTALAGINERARRMLRRRRATAAAATAAAVGVGLVTVPLVRPGGDSLVAAGAAASTAASTSTTPTPEPSGSPGAWPCGATGFDRALVRSAHGAATPQAALVALGYGTGRLSNPTTVRTGTVELREFDVVSGDLVGVYTIDQLDGGSWGVHSAQRAAACK